MQVAVVGLVCTRRMQITLPYAGWTTHRLFTMATVTTNRGLTVILTSHRTNASGSPRITVSTGGIGHVPISSSHCVKESWSLQVYTTGRALSSAVSVNSFKMAVCEKQFVWGKCFGEKILAERYKIS